MSLFVSPRASLAHALRPTAGLGIRRALALVLALVAVTRGLSWKNQAADIAQRTNVKGASMVSVALGGAADQGRILFGRNCAYCHGEDARGDEGPSLYDLHKSDARIQSVIQRGIKGEMPQVMTKFSDAEVQALIAFLRTLKT